MYQSYYNLSGKPFRLSPDPTFFFPSEGHQRALSYLRYGIDQNEGFVVVTGAPGTGKTTLAQVLLSEMDTRNVVVAHLTTTQLEADDLLRMVAASFGLRYEDVGKTALLKNIETFLLAKSRDRKSAILVIDEAQNLPMRSLEELRMLSNLQVGGRALLQTFLLGQLQFRNILDNPELEQLRQRIIANYHLGPLSAEETQDYVIARLYKVGWKHDPAFSDEVFTKVFTATEGVPRRINVIFDRILLFGCMEELHDISGEVVDSVIVEMEQEVSGRFVTSKQTSELIKGLSDSEQSKYSVDQTKGGKNLDSKQAEHKASDDQEILGNTVKRKNHSEADDNNFDIKGYPEQEQISERDLLHVIPGGKKYEQPGLSASADKALPVTSDGNAKSDTSDATLRRAIRLVLAFHRAPSKFPGLINPNQPIPTGVNELLELVAAENQDRLEQSLISAMGISPIVLKSAMRFFVQHVLLVDENYYHRVLGIVDGAPLSEIEHQYSLLMRLLREGTGSEMAECVKKIGHAYEALVGKSAERTKANDLAQCDSESESGMKQLHGNDLDIDFNGDVIDSRIRKRKSASEVIDEYSQNVNIQEPRRKFKLLGKLAFLSAVILIVTLAVYVTDLDLGENKEQLFQSKMGQQKLPESLDGIRDVPPLEQQTERRLGLSFNDGSLDSLSEDFVNKHSPDNSAGSEQIILGENAIGSITEDAPSKEANVESLASVDSDAGNQAAIKSEEPEVVKTQENAKQRIASKAQTQKNETKIVENKSARSSSVASKAPGEKSGIPTNDELEKVAPKSVQINKINPAQKQPRLVAKKPILSSERKLESGSKTNKITSITDRDLANLLFDFQNFYQFGNYKALAALFATTARTNSQINNAGIEAEFKEFFEKTSSRYISFTSPTWGNDGGFARGTGHYRVTVLPKGGEISKVKGKFTMQVYLNNGRLEISRFYFTDEIKLDPKPTDLNQIELDALVRNYAQYYEKGDVVKVIGLFAGSSRTNDQTTLAGIESDHVNLFKATQARKIVLTDIMWNILVGKAVGKGKFEVWLRKKGANNQNLIAEAIGAVKIEVIKTPEGLKISKFFHNTH